MNVVRELAPYGVGIPATEVFELVRVYSECLGFSGDDGLKFVVPESFKGVFHARV